MILKNLTRLNNLLLNYTSKNNNLKNFYPNLHNYKGNDWNQYVKFNYDSYNRNTIFKNNNYEMVIITWLPEQETKFHTHPSNGCLFKMLQGSLNEQLLLTNGIIKLNNFKYNNISYIDNNIGKHKIINTSNDIAVSLHIYSPPY